MELRTGDGLWRVTDIGIRAVIAIRIDRVEFEGGPPDPAADRTFELADAEGEFDGPPYTVRPC